MALTAEDDFLVGLDQRPNYARVHLIDLAPDLRRMAGEPDRSEIGKHGALHFGRKASEHVLHAIGHLRDHARSLIGAHFLNELSARVFAHVLVRRSAGLIATSPIGFRPARVPALVVDFVTSGADFVTL
jgi:hypothetical protein